MAEVGSLNINMSLTSAEFQKGIKDVNNRLKIAQSEFKLAGAGVQDFGKSLDGLKAKSKYLEDAIDLQQKKVDQLRQRYEQLKAVKGEDDAATQRMLTGYNNAQAALRRMESELQSTEQQIRTQSTAWYDLSQNLQAAGDRMKAFGDKMKDVGSGLTKSVTLPLVGMGTAAFKMSNDFNSAMANVSTLIPDNIKRIQELKKSVQDMAIETGKSTTDIADGLYQVVSTFGDTADTSKILEMNVKAAAAGMATTTDAINLTAAVSKGYNDTSSTMIQHISDLAFQTANLGITTFPELSSSIGGVVPLAATLGIKMDDLFAVFATGAGVTGSTSEVSTQFKTVLQSLMAPTDKMSELMKGLGYSNGQAMLKSLGLQGTINKIVDTAKAANTPLQDYISSIDGQTLALALNGNLSKGFTDNLKAMGNVAGSTDQAFKQQTEGINKTGFSWQQLKQKAGVALQNMGDAVGPVFLKILNMMEPMINKIQNLVNLFSKLDPSMQTIIIAFLGIVAAIGPVLVVLGTLISSIGSIMGVFAPLVAFIAEAGGLLPALGVAFTAITGPIGITIAVVAALVAVFVELWKNNEGFRNKVIEIWNAIKDAFNVSLNFIMNIVHAVMTNVMSFVSDILVKLEVFWIYHGSQIMSVVTTSFNFIWDTIKNVMAFIKGMFQADWPIISGIVQVAWAVIKTIVKTGIDLIMGIISVGLDLLTGRWDRLGNDLKAILKNIWNDIVNTFKGMDLEQIGKDIINGLINGIKSMGSAVWSEVKNIANSIPDGLKKFLGIASPSKVMRDQVGKWIPAGIAEGISGNISSINQASSKMVNSLMGTMGNGNQSVTNNRSLNVTVNNGSMDAYELTRYLQRMEVLYGG